MLAFYARSVAHTCLDWRKSEVEEVLLAYLRNQRSTARQLSARSYRAAGRRPEQPKQRGRGVSSYTDRDRPVAAEDVGGGELSV